MFPLDEFTTLAIVHFLTVASPGPNVIAAISNALTHGRKAGVLTCLGIATGNVFHMACGIFGVAFLVKNSPEIGTFLSLLGLSYLTYLGVKKIHQGLLQNKKTKLSTKNNQKDNFFFIGFVISITNVKGFMFFLMVFSTLIPASQTLQIKLFYGFWMAMVGFLLLSAMAWFFGNKKIAGRLFSHENRVHLAGGVAYLVVSSFLLYATLETLR